MFLAKSPKVGMGSASKHFAPRVLKPRLFVTDGSHESLSGFCLYFIKSSKSKAITASNIHTVRYVVYFCLGISVHKV